MITALFFSHILYTCTHRVIESKGPTNTRIYVVAVYFRDRRLATGKGHSIQEAEMNAATNALTNASKGWFPWRPRSFRFMSEHLLTAS